MRGSGPPQHINVRLGLPTLHIPCTLIRADTAVRLERHAVVKKHDMTDPLRRILGLQECNPHGVVLQGAVLLRDLLEVACAHPIVLDDRTVRKLAAERRRAPQRLADEATAIDLREA